MVPPSSGTFSASLHLTLDDFSFFAWGMVVRIKRSKTRSFGDSPVFIPFVAIPGSPICPVSAGRLHFSAFPASAASPAFLSGLGVPICQPAFVSHLRSALSAAGLNPAAYSGHSFRRGGASFAASLAQSHAAIKDLGDWKSDAYLRYINAPISLKSSLAKAFAAAIPASLSSTSLPAPPMPASSLSA